MAVAERQVGFFLQLVILSAINSLNFINQNECQIHGTDELICDYKGDETYESDQVLTRIKTLTFLKFGLGTIFVSGRHFPDLKIINILVINPPTTEINVCKHIHTSKTVVTHVGKRSCNTESKGTTTAKTTKSHVTRTTTDDSSINGTKSSHLLPTTKHTTTATTPKSHVTRTTTDDSPINGTKGSHLLPATKDWVIFQGIAAVILVGLVIYLVIICLLYNAQPRDIFKYEHEMRSLTSGYHSAGR